MPSSRRTRASTRSVASTPRAMSCAAKSAVRVGELREQERVDPLAVGGPADLPRQGGLDVGQQRELHLGEARDLPVVRQRQARAVEEEGVDVLLADDHGSRVVRDAAQVREQAGRLHLAGEGAQVPVEDRELGAAVDEGQAGLLRPLVPREQAGPREVQAVEERGLVVWLTERNVRLVEHVLEEQGLPEVREDAAHAPSSPGGAAAARRRGACGAGEEVQSRPFRAGQPSRLGYSGCHEVLDMKARFAKVLSRLSIVAVVAGSAVGAAACARSQPVDAQSTAAEATPEAAATPSLQGHTPGRHFFERVEAMDLRPGQREAMTEIEQNLAADLAPHRETMRQVAATLVAGVEAGRLAPEDTAAQRAALVAMVTDAKAVISGAINEVHDNLDADQRKELVEQLEAERAAHRAGPEAQHGDGPLARVALEIGLTEEQKQELKNEFKQELDELFPDRVARREANEARLNAMAQAFVTDDFDAADFDVAGGVEDGVKAFSAAAERAITISGTVLTQGQRSALAALLREHASHI